MSCHNTRNVAKVCHVIFKQAFRHIVDEVVFILFLKSFSPADQWSPVNPEGKKRYDRDFLLQFQKECTYKPDGLPNIPDIVLDRVSPLFYLCMLDRDKQVTVGITSAALAGLGEKHLIPK